MRRRPLALLLRVALCCAAASCSEPMRPADFAGTAPAFDPVTFWIGHEQSWGVLENRSGEPSRIVTTDCVGEADGADGLHMRQTLRVGDDPPQTREWRMRRVSPGHFEATANDMVGVASGEAAGRVFHWSWTLALSPGNDLKNVTMDQWMYAMEDGSMMNRTTIRKFGVVLAEVSEQFSRAK